MNKTFCKLCRRLGMRCAGPVRLANYAFGLLFLPRPWRYWLFGTGTRALKVLNVGVLCGWAAMLLHGGFGALPTYAGFSKVPVPWALAVLLSLALLLAWALYDGSLRGRVIGGAALMLSGFVWLAVSISFWAGYPPLHTGMFVYPLLSALSVLAGDHLRDEARIERHLAELKQQAGMAAAAPVRESPEG